MSYMNFSRANCKNCYKCLRYCPVKAIKFENEQAEIIEKRCINCGHCLVVCPQNARKVTSDLALVKEAIAKGKKVVGSIAPSFPGYFLGKEVGFISSLEKLGFYKVEETAIGAEVTTNLYKEYIKSHKRNSYITTCCPSANYLIEKYFPKLISQALPIVSPMIAHGKLIKKFYGEDCFTVFIGPCLTKIVEKEEYNGESPVNAVLTFEEINEWLEDEGIDLEKLNEKRKEEYFLDFGRNYPIHGGILNSIQNLEEVKDYEKISVDGIEECMELFEAMEKGEVENLLVEVSACKGSCIGGPSRIVKDEYFKRLKGVKDYNKRLKEKSLEKVTLNLQELNFTKVLKDKIVYNEEPYSEKLEEIMKTMGKYNIEDELNCGVCGYDTCRNKAKAIYNNMAEPTMCLNHMRSKAESISNLIFENTITCVILLDGDLNIKEINPAGERIFSVRRENIKDKPISILMGDEDFKYVKENNTSIIGKRIAIPQYNVVFMENIVYLPEQDLIMASMMNVIEEEKNRKELIKVKENTLNAAQEVIEKQMRVAQEIASLLGETTAETKIILSKLKKVVEGEEGEIR
ncbi:[Fe-Fe] hydrogenase large subunit C-terminal domain-containing protein [Clostridium malenominatum]|uniref:[Fe-Fe] hydrogenase large subunit C-terminal domain-containing protein n=1 Tax=Clostridium malenominatum TaxID=1539 RepID=A0ABP3U8R8_9CLOT